MATYEEAKDQYRQSLTKYGSQANTDENMRQFEDYWKNSADSGQMQGEGYNRSWSDVFGEAQAQNEKRYTRPTASNGGVGGSADANEDGRIDSSGWYGAAGSAGAAQTQNSNMDWYRQMMERQLAAQEAAAATNKQRGDQLYSTLMGRAGQSLNIDRNDPIIRAQADAYSANEERARRNYLGDVAESSGPYANMRGEERMSAERLGQRTGSFEAELLGRELVARRNEIQEALNGALGVLTADQARQLQLELGLMDQAIREQQLTLTGRGLDNDLQRILLQNEQFGRGLRSEEDMFAARLGFDATDRGS
jgi:hypothetical protein